MLKFVVGLTALLLTIQLSEEAKNDFTFLYVKDPSEKMVPLSNQRRYLDPSLPTIIIVHGWSDNGRSPWIRAMAKLYHQFGYYNVVSLDWSKKIANKSYSWVADRVPDVGKVIARALVKNVIKKDGLDVGKMHVIGHSLGAHLAGIMCQNVKKRLKKSVARLTGLDVARPNFEFPVSKAHDAKFSKGDADFVDAVHTNGGTRGVVSPCGDVDFYINGGLIQPGCGGSDVSFDKAASCSHQSSYIYYNQALKNRGSLTGIKCEYDYAELKLFDCDDSQKAEMGEFLNRTASGVYSITTDHNPLEV